MMLLQIHGRTDAVALVDDADYDELAQYRWHLLNGKHVIRYEYEGKRVKQAVLLHRHILGAPDGIPVDHINRDGLDNRRSNLRLASHSLNALNRGQRKGRELPICVTHDGRSFRARVRIHGHVFFERRYRTLDEATAAVEVAKRALDPEWRPAWSSAATP